MIQIRCDLYGIMLNFLLCLKFISCGNNGAFSIACILRMLIKHWSNARYFRKYIAVSLAPQMLQYIVCCWNKGNFYYISLTMVIQCYRKIFTFKMREVVSTLSSNHVDNMHYNVCNCFFSLLRSPSMTGNSCASFLSCFMVQNY